MRKQFRFSQVTPACPPGRAPVRKPIFDHTDVAVVCVQRDTYMELQIILLPSEIELCYFQVIYARHVASRGMAVPTKTHSLPY
jgi:hypothetical protein